MIKLWFGSYLFIAHLHNADENAAELPPGSQSAWDLPPSTPAGATAANPARMAWYKLRLQSADPDLLPVAGTAVAIEVTAITSKRGARGKMGFLHAIGQTG